MPVPANGDTIGIPRTIPGFRPVVRNFLRDRAPFNSLLDGEETSDDFLDMAILFAIDDFNTTAPVIGRFNMTNFPSMYLLLYGTVIFTMRSSGILQSRNSLTYSDGGINVSVSDKTPLYRQWIADFHNEYEQKKRHLKIQLNMRRAWGGSFSEYILASSAGTGSFIFGNLDGDSLARFGIF